jgi:preprotein translocase subunit Sec61beta
MAKDNKVRMPSSGAGITQYFDEYKSRIEFQPIHVVVFAIVVILIELLLWLSITPGV